MTDRPPTTSEYGVLGATASSGTDFHLDRVPAPADLSDLVERFWLVTWDLPPGRRSAVTLLPHPCVNLVFDRGLVVIAGVGSKTNTVQNIAGGGSGQEDLREPARFAQCSRFTYPLAGRGRVFGVKFRPGAFRPFLGGPVSQLTDQTVPLATLWGRDADRFAADLDAARDLPALVEVAGRHLRAHWPVPDPVVAVLGRIVHALLFDRTITRVEEVCARFDVRARTLQRLFQRYVGVSPKWVLRRYRLHEAAARLAEGTAGNWAEVAAELGYFDQPHFIRDFTRAIGMTPVAYAEACRRQQASVSA